MKRMLQKEYLNGMRNSRFIIIGLSFLLLALGIPLMVKVLLPFILETQLNGVDYDQISSMIDISQVGALSMYLKNTFEIGLIIVAFTLSGLIASEIKSNTLVIPLCNGCNYSSIILSKFIVHSLSLIVIATLTMIITYTFSGALFTYEIEFSSILRSLILDSILFIFIVSLILFLGTIVKKPIATGGLVIATVYVLTFIGKLFRINHLMPVGLHLQACELGNMFSKETVITICITVSLIIVMICLSIKQLEKVEWNQKQ